MIPFVEMMADALITDLVPEVPERSRNAVIAPGPVFSRKLHDQLLDFCVVAGLGSADSSSRRIFSQSVCGTTQEEYRA